MTESFETKLIQVLKMQGLARETGMLELTNNIFEYFAAEENDWLKASNEHKQQWHQEISRLFDALEFSLASASAYSSADQDLQSKIEALQLITNNLENQLNQDQKEKDRLSLKQKQLEKQIQNSISEKSQLENEIQAQSKKYTNFEQEITKFKQEFKQKQDDEQNLLGQKNKLQTELQKLEDKKAALQTEKANLLQTKDKLEDETLKPHGLEHEVEKLQKIVDLLHEFKTIVPFLDDIKQSIEISRIKQLALSSFVENTKNTKSRLKNLQKQIENSLQEMQNILQNEIQLKEKEWQTIRAKVEG